MNSKKLPLAASLVLAGLLTFTIACGGDDDEDNDNDGLTISTPVTDTTDAADTLPTEPAANGEANDREEFVTTVEAQLEQIETRMTDVEAEVASMSGDDQATAQTRLDQVKATISDVEADLSEVEAAPDGEYETLRTEIEAKVDTTMTEMQEFAEELGI